MGKGKGGSGERETGKKWTWVSGRETGRREERTGNG